MELPIFVVDAFSDTQFKGNSAAVVPLDDWIDDALMQSIAVENNLSETAFIKKIAANKFEIRWFSPLTEIDFCGHATLASSFILYQYYDVKGEIEFATKYVGSLSVNQISDNHIEMSFPNQCPEVVDDIPSALLTGLSIKPIKVLKNRQAYYAVFKAVQDVLDVTYHAESLKLLAPYDLVVAASDVTYVCGDLKHKRVDADDYLADLGNDYDFVSRYFWPANGGHEDPVTGSIHAGLAPYWAEQLNKSKLNAFQASTRGGVLSCEVKGERVFVSGDAVLYLQGKIFV